MKIGIIHYNFPDHSMSEFLRVVKDIGYEYVEIACRDIWDEKNPNDAPERNAKNLRKEMDEVGLKTSAFSAGNDFVLLDEGVIAQQIERMKRVCRLAKILGTNVIRTEGGRPKPEVPEEKWADAIADCLKRCVDFIEKEDFYLAVDNHGLVTNNAELQVEIFEKVGSKHVGANLDTMNYRWAGHDLETVGRFYEIIAPYVFHTHLKDGIGCQKEYQGRALGEGEIDLKKAIECLKKAGYDGVYCVEYERKDEDRVLGAKKCIEWLRANL